MAVLIIVIIVPIVVFGITFFITSSTIRYDAQTRSMKALYLAEAGIHQGIFNIRSTGSLGTVADWDANNQITVTQIPGCSNQLKSVGTSISSVDSIKRTVYAQFASNNVQIYMEGLEAVNPLPPCCSEISWPFSEGSGNTTGTAPYQGTLTPGNPNPGWTSDRLGVANRALMFNDTGTHDYVIVNDSTGSDLDLTFAGTVMAWINPSAIPNQNMQAIVHKGGATTASNAYALFLDQTSNNRARVSFWIYQGTTQYLASGASNAVLRNRWVHLAGVWDSAGLRVYRNGLPDGTTATANRVANSNNNSLYMGASGTLATAQEFAGKIDEVFVYGCRKTDADIKAYYNSTCAGSGATPCPQP
jgi:hypothetical protein